MRPDRGRAAPDPAAASHPVPKFGPSGGAVARRQVNPVRPPARADLLLEDGDTEGAAIWRRILAAIEELMRGRREGEAVN